MKPSRSKRRPKVVPFLLPAPGPAPVRPLPKPMNEEAIEVVRERTGERKQIDPRRWPDYGLARIPVSTAPFRITFPGVLLRLRRVGLKIFEVWK